MKVPAVDFFRLSTLRGTKPAFLTLSLNAFLHKLVRNDAGQMLSIVTRGGGGYLTKFNTGRLCPEVQPLTLLYTILAEKVPLLYIFY